MKQLLALVLSLVPTFAGTVPGYYILELKAPPAADRVVSERLPNRRAAALGRRASVRAEQETFRRAADVRDVEVVSRLDLIANALVLRIDDARAAELAQRPEVARVTPVHEMTPLMDHAIVLEQVPQAWALIGGVGNAGAGIKIAIIDSGIETSHPAFQDPNLAVPDGFPIVSTPTYAAATSNKVTVARSYEQFYGVPAPANFDDSTGHGTSVSMAAAGVQHMSPIGLLSGIAPKAWIGAYKVFVKGIAKANDAAVTKALEDAVADGMDVANLSLGFGDWYSPINFQDFPVGAAQERASAMGLIIVNAAGNAGPERSTVTALTPSVLSAAASGNDRVFGGPVNLDDGTSYVSIPLGAPSDWPAPISGQLFDVHTLDASGEACAALPDGSLAGLIAVITRGPESCDLEVKVNNVQKAGAIAVLVYAGPDVPELNYFDIGAAKLAAAGLSNADGQDVLRKFKANSNLTVTLHFAGDPLTVDPNRIASFSSRGPDANDQIRPDVTAVGQFVYLAYLNGNYIGEEGTSFAAPQISGAVAVLKAARPGLSMDQYRSLIVNTATTMRDASGTILPVMHQGAGLLNLAAAAASTLTAAPWSISFGSGPAADASRDLTIGNLGTADDTLTLSILSDGTTVPSLSTNSVSIAAGGMATFSVRFTASQLAPGEYQGFVRVQAASGSEIRIPYWFGVPSGVTRYIKASVANIPEVGSTSQFVIALRATDAIGIPVTDPAPTVRVLSGLAHLDAVVYEAGFRALVGVKASFGMDPATTVFRIQSGAMQKDITVKSIIPDTARIVVAQTTLDFAAGLSGLTKDLTFTVGNRGGPPLNVTAITSSNPVFRITSTTPFSVIRGAQQTVTVRFSPTGAGAQTGTLAIQSNDPTQPAIKMQLTATGIAAAGPLVLQVDGGTLTGSIGFPNGASTAYFLNRLTPPKYPATLQSVQVYFGDRTNGLNQDTAITVVAGSNFTGGSTINGVTLQRTNAAVGKLGTFTTYTVPSVTITAGDFVVGFMVNNPANIYPADQDTTTASQGRSYVSTNGTSFSIIDSVVPGNFGIRATVVFTSP